MPRFALALLLVTACGAAMPPPVAPVPRASVAAKQPHPMVGDWIGTLSIAYAPAGQPTVYDEKPFALKLDNAPTSLGGAGGPCDLRAMQEGDHVRFPAGQTCAGKKQGEDFVTTLREGTLAIVDGKLELSLVFDGTGGDQLVVRGALARRAKSALARWSM
jgi:hypothetical protein